MLETTFAEETVTDLFGEQAVLCGGASALVQAGFETLVAAGYQPEIAYFECLHELKLIVDLMYEGGLAGMRYSISDTAEYGDLTRGPLIVDEHVRETMSEILENIQSGQFAREFVNENASGRTVLKSLRDRSSAHQIEEVGAKLRAMMPFVKGGKAPAKQTELAYRQLIDARMLWSAIRRCCSGTRGLYRGLRTVESTMRPHRARAAGWMRTPSRASR